MAEYWESRFISEGALWKSEPSDSALVAMKIFREHRNEKILIPGVGYGRNAALFHEAGFQVTGVEISKSAIELARNSGLAFKIHHGSVTEMPFDDEIYDGIFCYALVHLLNRNERRKFIRACFDQLKEGGLMIFVVATKNLGMYGSGKLLSKDRYRIAPGLEVFFYDDVSIQKEFSDFGLIKFDEISEPVKFNPGFEPMRLKFLLCQKQAS